MAATPGQPQPKPQSLAKPVPGDDLANAAKAFMAQQSQGQVELPSTPSAQAQGEEEQFAPVEVQEEAPQEPGVGMQALDAAGRVLDYAGGAVRTGLANAAGLVTGQGNIVTEKDLKNVAKGKAPDSAEYLRRLGVPEGGSVNIGGQKFTTRGAAGFALDVATDPLTLITKAIKGTPYLKKLLNSETSGVANKLAQTLGETVYKSALPEGVEAAGQTLIKNGAPIVGRAGLARKVEEAAGTMGKLRQGLYDRATELGVSIDASYPLKRAEAMLTNIRKDKALAPVADELEQLLNVYKGQGKVPIDLVSTWKTNLYDALPASAFNGPKLKNKAKAFKYALAADFRDAIIQAGNKAEKGLGDSIAKINDEWGTLLEALPGTMKAAKKGGGGKLGVMIDGAVAAVGGPKAYIAKKAYDVASGTAAKTLVGRALMEAGRKDLASRLSRQAIAAPTRNPGAPEAVPEEIEE